MAVAESNVRLGHGGGLGRSYGNEGLLVAARPETLARDPQNPASWGRVGRNELCPCGSGKKYKHCHGVIV